MSELKPCPFCGGEAEMLTAESMHGGYLFGIMCDDCRSRGDVYDTEAEAIAAWNTRVDYHGYEQAAIEAWESIKAWNSRAELGSELPYDELLRCLENDWNIRASWDGLRKFWSIELTEEGVRLRDAELNSRAERTCECIACAYFENKSTCGAYCNYFDRELGDDYDGGCTWGVLSGCKVVGE